MSGYVLSPLARRDLEAIDDYVGAENPAAADRLLDSFRATFDMLAAHPAAGRRRDELRPGLRSFPVGTYIVFYREMRGIVEIVRVLHARVISSGSSTISSVRITVRPNEYDDIGSMWSAGDVTEKIEETRGTAATPATGRGTAVPSCRSADGDR